MKLPVEIKITDPAIHEFGGLPRTASEGSAAVDLVALGVFATTADFKPDFSRRTPLEGTLHLEPGEMAYICVGLSIHIGDPGYAALIMARSSSSALGIRMGNGHGLIDATYAGPLAVCVENRLSQGTSIQREVCVHRGERIAQMYFTPVLQPEWQLVDEFTKSSVRGAGAYGSTGRI